MKTCAICGVVSEPVSSTLRLWICPRYLDWSEFNERDEHALRSLFGLRDDGRVLSAEDVADEFDRRSSTSGPSRSKRSAVSGIGRDLQTMWPDPVEPVRS
jgi:hypothetical protein